MRRMTLLRLFTPSSAPGSGNTNRMLSFLISKYDFFSGYFSTNLRPQKTHCAYLIAPLSSRQCMAEILGEGLALHTLEGLQLPVLEVDDVSALWGRMAKHKRRKPLQEHRLPKRSLYHRGAHLVQEWAEMGSANDAAIEGLQPVFQPPGVRCTRRQGTALYARPRHLMLSTSRCPVGSSNMSTSTTFMIHGHSARARC